MLLLSSVLRTSLYNEHPWNSLRAGMVSTSIYSIFRFLLLSTTLVCTAADHWGILLPPTACIDTVINIFWCLGAALMLCCIFYGTLASKNEKHFIQRHRHRSWWYLCRVYCDIIFQCIIFHCHVCSSTLNLVNWHRKFWIINFNTDVRFSLFRLLFDN